MSNEFTISAQIKLNNGNLQYTGAPASYQANQTTQNGPTPGAVTATTGGIDISLTQLTTPGFVQITNLDSTNYVTFGLHDGSTYRPLGECLPGETAVFRLARNILTANTAADKLYLMANTANCNCLVNAFDK